MTDYQVRLRLLIFQGSIILLFGVFVIQLARLQFFEGEKYRQLADRNRFRTVDIEAPRGIIYDQGGNLLVRNRPIFNVEIVPAYLPEDPTTEAQLFARLAGLLKLPITNGGAREIPWNNAYFRSFLHHEYTRLPDRQVRNSRSRRLAESPQGIKDIVDNAPIFAPYQSVVIAEDIDPEVAATIEQDRLNLPGVFIQTGSEREYLTGELTSGILGYVGPIPPNKVDNYQPPLYSPDDHVGLVGLEVSYEDLLHGTKGREIVEVDVTGRKIKTIGDATPAQPGNNISLTLDIELQQFVTDQLQAAIDESGGQSGATVVLNPQTGEVLAMVSLPSYDNNLFAQGISTREFSLLSEDRSTPLVNKAIGGLYPPGSTFKIVPASGALQEGTVAPEQQFLDEGIIYLPNKFFPDDPKLAQPFYGWARDGLGWVNVVGALAQSSDIYFYQVGGGYEPSGYEGLGLTNLVKYAEMFGFGLPTEIDIPGEGVGLIPTRKWKRLNYAETWVTGDTYNMAIGQGFVLATPLQVVNAYAAFGNGGTLYKPYLVKEVRSPQKELVYQAKPEVIGTLKLDDDIKKWVEEGLRGVIDWGTGKGIIDVPGIAVSGKTGTAEFCDRYPQCLDKDGRVKTSHAWFVAYAPSDKPQIAVVTFVYGGGEGSLVAGPVVNSILRYYFGIDKGQTEDEPVEPSEPAAVTGNQFSAQFLGSDSVPGSTAAISGFVLDAQGRGVQDAVVNLIADGEVYARIVSGPTGQFDYNAIDPQIAESWQVELADYATVTPLTLSFIAGNRYLIEFKALESGYEF